MLNQYALKFTGKISCEGKGNGLPDEIYAYVIVEGNGGPQEKAFIDATIENQTMAFIRMQAMAVQRDQGSIIDMRQTPADRILVPFRWIVSISTSIYHLNGEMSEPDENGTERLKDGSTPQIN